MLLILGGQKCREMMIEPPGDLRRRGVFEVNDGILIAGELALVKERPGSMHKAVVLVTSTLGNALAMKPREQRRRAGPVKALVVIKDPNLQSPLRTRHPVKPES